MSEFLHKVSVDNNLPVAIFAQVCLCCLPQPHVHLHMAGAACFCLEGRLGIAWADFRWSKYDSQYLDLTAGEYVFIVHSDQLGWVWGRRQRDRVTGWFPESYWEAPTGLIASFLKGRIGVVLADFRWSENGSEYLDLTAGEFVFIEHADYKLGWAWGRRQRDRVTGWFPDTYWAPPTYLELAAAADLELRAAADFYIAPAANLEAADLELAAAADLELRAAADFELAPAANLELAPAADLELAPAADQTLPSPRGDVAADSSECDGGSEGWRYTRRYTSINLNRLQSAQNLGLLVEMDQCVRQLGKSAALRQGLETILDISSDEFKELSYDGFVWIKGRPIDSGNWVYSLLFGWLLRGRVPLNIVGLLRSLGKRYATLREGHPTSSDSMERRGDVLEVVLSQCRLTGMSIPKATRAYRECAHGLIRQFHFHVERLHRVLADEYVPKSRWPDPEHVLDQIEMRLSSA